MCAMSISEGGRERRGQSVLEALHDEPAVGRQKLGRVACVRAQHDEVAAELTSQSVLAQRRAG